MKRVEVWSNKSRIPPGLTFGCQAPFAYKDTSDCVKQVFQERGKTGQYLGVTSGVKSSLVWAEVEQKLMRTDNVRPVKREDKEVMKENGWKEMSKSDGSKVLVFDPKEEQEEEAPGEEVPVRRRINEKSKDEKMEEKNQCRRRFTRRPQ